MFLSDQFIEKKRDKTRAQLIYQLADTHSTCLVTLSLSKVFDNHI